MSDVPQTSLSEDEPFDLEREPLDQPHPVERDWGGDGSDLTRPVRAHVLAALRPNTAPYPPPLDALLTLGDAREADVTERRRTLDLRQEHLRDLVRMARDRDLYTANGETLEVWAPLHAVHALDDLDASSVVPELIPLFDLEDDWFATLLPDLLGKIGAPAIEPLRGYIADQTRWAFGRSIACDALEKIAGQHPDLREQVIGILSDVLRDAEHEVVSTGAMSSLVELKAVEALPSIRRAFEQGRVDETVRGAWGDVLEELRVKPDADDPLIAASRQRFEERHERMFPRKQREELQAALSRYTGRDLYGAAEAEVARMPAAPPGAKKTAQDQARKQKNKRKMASAARKTNRRKRK